MGEHRTGTVVTLFSLPLRRHFDLVGLRPEPMEQEHLDRVRQRADIVRERVQLFGELPERREDAGRRVVRQQIVRHSEIVHAAARDFNGLLTGAGGYPAGLGTDTISDTTATICSEGAPWDGWTAT